MTQTNSPVTGMVVDEFGRVFVTGGYEVMVFDSRGRMLGSMDYGGFGVALTDEGDLLAMDQFELFRFEVLIGD